MFAVFASVFLCLVSLSRSAPLACEDQLKPLQQLDPQHLEGRWALVAGSLNDSRAEDVLKARDSVAIDFTSSRYTQLNRHGDACQSFLRNVSIEGSEVNITVPGFNFTGTFYSTSCPDCVLISLDIESQNFMTRDFYLFSKRQKVTNEEMDEFNSQVACLNMPPPVVMDPNKELCPEQTDNQPDSQATGSTEGQTS